MRVMVVLLAVALALSTLLGIAIALNMRGRRFVTLLLLAAGTVVPIVLLKL